MTWTALAAIAAAALALSGCSNLGYYWQTATGHLRVLGAHIASPA